MRTDYVPIRGGNSRRDGIGKAYVVEGSTALKVGIVGIYFMLNQVLYRFFSLFLSSWITIPVLIIFSAMTYALAIGLSRGFIYKRAMVRRTHGNLQDEAAKLVKAHVTILNAKRLRPEGVGITERSYEFGRLAFNMIKKMEEMDSVNVGRSTNNTKHKYISDLQIEANNLASSGWDLADLIANDRAKNIVEDVEYMGAKEFMDEVNLQTMAHKSLGTGDSPKVNRRTGEIKPIPPRPRKKGVPR